MDTKTPKTTATRTRIKLVDPPRTMTEAQAQQWANAMGVPLEHAILMAMIASERPGIDGRHREEQMAVMSTAVNRARWPGTFGIGKPGQSNMWRVVVGHRTTGAQGPREYATTRPPSGAAELVYYAGLAAEVYANGVTTGATHFHHWPNAERRDYIRGRRQAQGYALVRVDGVARNADFFAPTSSKIAGFNRTEGLVA